MFEGDDETHDVQTYDHGRHAKTGVQSAPEAYLERIRGMSDSYELRVIFLVSWLANCDAGVGVVEGQGMLILSPRDWTAPHRSTDPTSDTRSHPEFGK